MVVELKNDLSICGTLHSVDQYLNIKLTDISVTDPEKYPHMVSIRFLGIFTTSGIYCSEGTLVKPATRVWTGCQLQHHLVWYSGI